MKKKLFFLPLLAALVLAGCSKEESDAGGGNGNGDNGEQYLAISVVSTDSSASVRAESDPYNGDYEDGTTDENAVTRLRIYFFNTKGMPVNVKGHADKGNWYDVPLDDIETSGAEHGETVEKKINAVMVVNQGEQVPSQLVAVLNRDTGSEGLGDGPYTLTDLRRKVGNYANLANTNKLFVMANSVYLDGGNIVEAQSILPENLQKSTADAKDHPVTIYVERNVAKVRIKATIAGRETLADGGIMCPVYNKDTKEKYTYTIVDDKTGTETEMPVYVKFHGWDISADLKYAYLSKNIRVGWKANILGAGNWNDPAHHRSYWADVCDGGTEQTINENQYFSYNSTSNFAFKKFDGTEFKYCNENGEKQVPNTSTIYKATKVLIKGELCDVDGNSLTFTEFAGTRVVDDDNFSNLKAHYLLLLKSGRSHSHWKVYKDAKGTVTKAEEITADDITFMTANEQLNRSKASATTVDNGSYYVYACLKSDVAASKDFEWYTNITTEDITDADGNVTGQTITVDDKEKVSAEKVNEHLTGLTHAKIWNGGKTYYYAEIMHGNQAGVVRNHIYDVNLKEVYGFGTPVYNPDEAIVPEKPTDDDTYVAAEIKILSWRLMTQDVVFDWD